MTTTAPPASPASPRAPVKLAPRAAALLFPLGAAGGSASLLLRR